MRHKNGLKWRVSTKCAITCLNVAHFRLRHAVSVEQPVDGRSNLFKGAGEISTGEFTTTAAPTN